MPNKTKDKFLRTSSEYLELDTIDYKIASRNNPPKHFCIPAKKKDSESSFLRVSYSIKL